MTRVIATLGLICLTACSSMSENKAPVTPQRPSVSSDPNTTASGTFELEAGGEVDPGDSLSTPMTLKYGAGERTEVFLGFSPINRIDRPGDNGRGIGDTLLGVRHRFWESEQNTSMAFQLATKFPTADEKEGLGSGEQDFFAAGMLAHALSETTSLLGYYEYGVLGDSGASSTDSQHTFAVAASHAISDPTGVFGEWASTVGRNGEEPMLVTLGAAHKLASGVVLDAGLQLGMNDDAPDLQLVFGLTINLGGPGQ